MDWVSFGMVSTGSLEMLRFRLALQMRSDSGLPPPKVIFSQLAVHPLCPCRWQSPEVWGFSSFRKSAAGILFFRVSFILSLGHQLCFQYKGQFELKAN